MQEISGYIIQETINEGNRFTILRAVRNSDQQRVVLKLCRFEPPNTDDLTKLQHEYRILKQLDSPQVVKVYDLIKQGRQLVLVLEDVGGESLKQFLDGKPLSLEVFFKITLQLISALSNFHIKNIIHQNISSHNILINPETDSIKVTNLSVSTQLNRDTKEPIPLQKMEGDLEYISPEQTGRMNRSVDYRTDFYSLGVVLYEMLSGTPPFQAQDHLELIHSHLAQKPHDLHEVNPKVPEALAVIILKLLAKAPTDRYASTVGLKADVLRCQLEWQKNHQIEPFILGEQDVYDYLTISQKVYGREREISQLLEAFREVSHGKKELLLLSGYAGIGKSSIVKEIVKSVSARKGYFATGKYDRLNQKAPYNAFISAFQELIHHLLSESDVFLEVLKENLLKALGSNGQIIVDMIPEVELIIGKQPSISPLLPSESQNRFVLIFKKFIRVFANSEHPLVLFLEDLQWIDSASLEFFKSLLVDAELQYLLLIGSYRNNEVGVEHPFMDALQALKISNEVQIKELVVPPLTKEAIQNLLVDSLNSAVADVDELADLLLFKTHGNPFFINELLEKLYHENCLVFSYDNRKWQWDLERIRQEPITENVVDLLVHKIQQLPKEARDLLELSALMGHTFELSNLSIMSGYSLSKTAGYIFASLEVNLVALLGDHARLLEGIKEEIVPETDQKIEFCFVHERVQQAAYQLIPEEIRSHIHLKMGRLLLGQNKDENSKKQDDRLFEILHHFNESISLVTDDTECYQLAELNLLAGKKSKTSIAYETAVAYFQSSMKFLKIYDWSKDYQLLFDLHLEISECLFLLKKFDDAMAYITELLKHAATDIDSGRIHICTIKAYVNSARHREVIDASRVALKLFDFHLPTKPGSFDVLKEIVPIKCRKKIRSEQKIRTPAADPRVLIVGEILAVASSSAYQVDQYLFSYLACKVLNFGFSEGYIPQTPLACLGYAMILICQFNQIEEAFYYVDLAKDLQKELGPRAAESKINFVMGAFINHWKYPLKSSLGYLKKSYQFGIAEGNLAYAVYSQLSCLAMYYSGSVLMSVKEKLEKSIHFLHYAGDEGFYYFFLFMKDVIVLLEEDNTLIHTDLKIIFSKVSKEDNKTVAAFTCIMYAQLLYIKGDYQEAKEMSEKAYALKDFVKGGFDFVFISLFHGLCLAANYTNSSRSEKSKSRQILKSIQKQFKQWSDYNPENFLYAYWLISAEIERLKKGFHVEIIQLYNKAILEAQKYDYIQFVAIANECAARFCLDSKYAPFAKAYLQDAYYTYLQWGAFAKCRELENQHSDMLQVKHSNYSNKKLTASVGVATSHLDVLSLFKSTQAISGEIQLEKLLQKLMRILLQNAGAERAVLLLKEGRAWFIEAEGTVMDQKITLSQADPLKNRLDLPLSLITYVNRTKDLLLIRTVRELEEHIAEDLYLEQVKPQSILIIPIFYQGILRNMLYLENRASTHAFTPTSIQTLKVLASQAAVSLENARLYHQATHDPLTGLANRNLLYQDFEMARSRTKRANKKIAILFLDLDGFKRINDTFGHELGDMALLRFSEKIKTCLRDSDFTARLGGDEFVVMLEGSELEQTILVVERILKIFDKPVKIQGHEIYVSVSIGISFYPTDGDTIQELLKQADVALYKAKDSRQSNYQFYKSEFNVQLQEKHAQETEMRKALENNEFCLYYQPIVNGGDRKVLHLEALIRWKHPTKGIILPINFIALAEKTGLILSMGDWVLKEVFSQLKMWQEARVPLLPVAINISGFQFKKQRISKNIEQLLKEFQIGSKYIQLEFTEGVFIDEIEQVVSDILALKKMGISLAIDDFGTFYSSLSYLKRFPVDKIKIDQSFVQGIDKNEDDKVLILAIIAMAHALKLKIIAEGVENEAQALFLEKNGVDALQGFHLERPMTAKACTEYLRNINPSGR